MPLERRYILLAHLCSGLSILSYALAGAEAALGVVALTILVIEWFFVSGPGRKPLPRIVINAALLLTTAAMAWELTGQAEEFVSVIARYMAWLQLIKHAEAKTPRDQGQLLALTAMLVVAATLTNVSVLVGLTLLVYLPLLLTTVMYFQIYAGQINAARANPGVRRAAPGRAAGLPLAAGRGLNRHLSSAITFAAIAIASGATVIFLVFPRGIGESFLGEISAPAAGAVTGFSDSVQLGGRGVISQSPAIALELRVTGPAPTGDGVRPTYHLRGAVLDQYRWDTSTWSRSEIASSGDNPQPGYRPPNQIPPGDFSQQITIFNKQSDHLFAIWKPIAVQVETASSYRYSIGRDSVILLPDRMGHVSYVVASTSPRPHEQERGVSPVARAPRQITDRDGRIAQLGARILRDAGVGDGATDREKAQAIQTYLERSCVYTLDRPPLRFDEDPIEAFLFRTRAGHCEYFASGMVALAWSVGLDARVVTGFVAAEYDDARDRYIVRQSHAHAWAEVWTDGRWETFDPAAREARQAAAPRGVLSQFRLFFDRLESLWVRSVVTFDSENQARLLEGRSRNASGALRNVGDWVSRLTRPQGDDAVQAGRSPVEIAAYAGVMIAGGILVWIGGSLILRGRRGVRRTGPKRPGVGRRARRQQSFYRAMLRALDRKRLGKPQWRPPLDHADALRAHDHALAGAVARLTDLYYASRFGGRLLTDAEIDEAQVLLASIERGPRD